MSLQVKRRAGFQSDNSIRKPRGMLAGDAAARKHLGNAVAVSGDIAVVGAPGDDDGGEGPGSASQTAARLLDADLEAHGCTRPSRHRRETERRYCL
eukprot:COSAG02_NODE_1908_length_10422_cov_3.592270_9_plen_96_part_00